MANLTAPTAADIQVINWAGIPLAEWVAQGNGRSVNFWASEDGQWAYFQRATPLHERGDRATDWRIGVSYDEAGRILARM